MDLEYRIFRLAKTGCGEFEERILIGRTESSAEYQVNQEPLQLLAPPSLRLPLQKPPVQHLGCSKFPVGECHLRQNFDLMSSHWDGSSWSVPVVVSDDTYLDGNPQVAWDSFGNGLAVWERMNDPALPITATFDTTSTQKILPQSTPAPPRSALSSLPTSTATLSIPTTSARMTGACILTQP